MNGPHVNTNVTHFPVWHVRSVWQQNINLTHSPVCRTESFLEWLFFQNATQVQLHGGKNPIVLYQEMKLQFELHVSIEPAAASWQRFNWSGPPPETRNFSRNTWYMYQVFLQKVSCSQRGTWPVEPLQGSCSRLNADVKLKLQLHFLVQYNRVFTTVKMH